MSAEPVAPILSLRGVGKRYGAVVAVEGVDLDVFPGEVLALCGDNGAGKSSLIKLISGAEAPTGGTIALRGKPVRFRSPHDALSQGVATIYQELALAPRLSIAANVFMGAERRRPLLGPLLGLLDKRRMRREAKAYLARLGVGIEDMERPVERLSGGQRQAVAIARALRWDAGIVVMDEPTAALGVRETALVNDLVRRLKAEGRTVILISHDTRDVVALADRVAIMGQGRLRSVRPVAGLAPDALGRLILDSHAEAA